jgi:hypothetical protein
MGRPCTELGGCRVPVPSPVPESPPSLAASLSAQQSTLHTGPVVQAPSADFDKGQNSFRFPIAQSAAADWQPCQQSLFVNEAGLARKPSGWKLCPFAIHVAAFLLITARL